MERNSITLPSKAASNVVKGAFEHYGLKDGGEPDVCDGGDVGKAPTESDPAEKLRFV